ncbi:tail fiber domain-containing protein [Alphaproteobacteria bacterium]|nr:tail fiber domain-containing protein [Alphaproteobacteria bacterium]
MSKISELSDGGSLLPTDFLIAVRSGGNVKVQADQTEFDRIRLGDNEKIELGNSQDMELYFSGSGGFINNATGDLTLDVAGDIILDADGGDIRFKDGGTHIGSLYNSSNNFAIYSAVNNADLLLQGQDGGSTITALTLDMSAAGAATFNSTIATGSGGASGKIAIAGNTATSEATHITFTNGAGAKVFAVGGGQSGVTNNGFVIRNVTDNTFPLVISDAGAATFNGTIAGTRISLSDGVDDAGSGGSETVFNNDGTTANFRVESTGNANMLFIDGGTNRVGVGTASPGEALDIQAGNARITGGNELLLLNSSNNTNTGIKNSGGDGVATLAFDVAGTNVFNIASSGAATFSSSVTSTAVNITSTTPIVTFTESDQSNKQYQIGSFGSAFAINDASNTQFRYILDTNGNHIFNEGGADSDFRVESSGNANAFHVDGATSIVGINTNNISSYTASNALVSKGRDFALVGTAASGATSNNIRFWQDSGTAYEIARIETNVGAGQINRGEMKFQVNNGASLRRWLDVSYTGNVVFNQDGNDSDFRVESSGNANALFVDGGTNNVGIGTGAPISLDGNATPGLTITNNGPFICLQDANNADKVNYISNNSGVMQFGLVGDNGSTGKTEVMSLSSAGAIFNEGHDAALDFRVESDTNALAFVVDAGANTVAIGRQTTWSFSSNTTPGFAVNVTSGRLDVAADSVARITQINDATGTYDRFYRGSSIVGSITTDGSNTAYNTSSDQRLKEKIADADDAGSKVDSIQVRKFDWKADGQHQDYGMIAQELIEVAPEAVSAPEDPDEMMGVDYSKLVPMLVKEIQQLRQRVAQLES